MLTTLQWCSSVEDGGGDHGIPEEFLPVGEAFVRGDDGGAALVAVETNWKNRLRLSAVDGQIPDSSTTTSGEVNRPCGWTGFP